MIRRIMQIEEGGYRLLKPKAEADNNLRENVI